MRQIISAFEAGGKYGGGVVTKKLLGYFGSEYVHISRSNQERRFVRFLRALLIWLRCPILHPVFCTFGPRPVKGGGVLNFSQTFNLAVRFPALEFELVAHDVIVQKRLPLNAWVRWSEKRIFKSAKRIYVLSEKDRRLLRRFYGVRDDRVVNLFEKLYPEVEPFRAKVRKRGVFRAIFLGSIRRAENYRGLEWFYYNVFPSCVDSIEVFCIGEVDDHLAARFPEFKFVGFVESLSDALSHCDFTIAPVLDGAGIKIKVIDSIVRKIPVIGTPKAFEGIGRPNYPYCSSDAKNWIDALNGGFIDYVYHPPL
ncbi:glycosyltransferase [Ectopseudomonas chengduensis]|uniref:glycosyltransferase n=1 Tax=Ectopseudomonas oleovorans TaxID=301 RepID=UPI000B84998D